jgi:hypothetical protein
MNSEDIKDSGRLRTDIGIGMNTVVLSVSVLTSYCLDVPFYKAGLIVIFAMLATLALLALVLK